PKAQPDGSDRVFVHIAGWLLFAAFIKWSGHDLGRHTPPADLDVKARADGRLINRQISQADVLVQERGRAAGSDVSDGLRAAGQKNRIAVAPDPALDHLEADQLAFHALGLLRGQPLAPDEIAFVEFHDPPEVGFVCRRGVVNLVAVERHLRFEPERVARRQTAGQHPVRTPGFEYFVPDAL